MLATCLQERKVEKCTSAASDRLMSSKWLPPLLSASRCPDVLLEEEEQLEETDCRLQIL